MFVGGFTSHCNFYRYFAGVEKMSPSEYLKNALAKRERKSKILSNGRLWNFAQL